MKMPTILFFAGPDSGMVQMFSYVTWRDILFKHNLAGECLVLEIVLFSISLWDLDLQGLIPLWLKGLPTPGAPMPGSVSTTGSAYAGSASQSLHYPAVRHCERSVILSSRAAFLFSGDHLLHKTTCLCKRNPAECCTLSRNCS